MSNIFTIKPNNSVLKEALIELGSNEDLDNFQIVCHWKCGNTTCGWSTGLPVGLLVFGAELLKHEVNETVFGEEDEESPRA